MTLAALGPEGRLCTNDSVQLWPCLHQCLQLMPMHLVFSSSSSVGQ